MIDNSTFIIEQPLNTAVLLLVFNRLDTTKQVFEAIKQAKPPRLYIAADGARKTKEGEEQKVKLVRDYIISNIDWKCEVKTLFREQNLGCKMAVSGAIDWFFKNEEMGIVLEDDCLPSQSFFWFCEQLLIKYKNDMRVWHVSGATIKSEDNFNFSYHFSNYPGIWGWASWSNRWIHYDVEIKKYQNKNNLKKINKDISINYWAVIFEKVKNNMIDTWDFQWIFAMWLNSGMAITPNTNQIRNIGFNLEATHTTDPESDLAKLKRGNINTILHPEEISIVKKNDKYLTKKYFSKRSLIKRILKKILSK